MICGGTKNVSQSEKFNLWENGVVLSFDFVVDDLKTYYSETSPQGAYEVIKNFLLKNGFEHLKDSDYKNVHIDDLETADLLYHFSRENKWFPYCLKKMDISPNVIKLDVSRDIWAFRDEEWAEQHLKEKRGDIGESDLGTMQGYQAEIKKLRNSGDKMDSQELKMQRSGKGRNDR